VTPVIEGPDEAAWAEYRRNVRHELRTPVNHIMSYAELLLDDAHDQGLSDLVKVLEAAQSAGKALLPLISGFLETPPAPGELRPDPSRATLITLAEEVAERIARVIQDPSVQAHPDIIVDLQRIREAAERLLGLVEATATPVMGDGPAIARDLAPTNVIHEAARTDATDAGAGLILAVDDDELNRDVLARTLTRLGYRVICAEDGQRALDILARETIDLVLLDVLMPGLNGFEVLSRRRLNPALRDVPFVMISGLDDLDSIVRCIEMGAEDYLPKPFDPVLLRARVGACLEKKRLRDQEVEYLQQVMVVTAAAAAVETRSGLPERLLGVSERTDELGQLARVFQEMAREVYAREDRLQRDLHQLQIQIDESKKARQVAEVTETEYFQQLQQRAADLRSSGAARREDP